MPGSKRQLEPRRHNTGPQRLDHLQNQGLREIATSALFAPPASPLGRADETELGSLELPAQFHKLPHRHQGASRGTRHKNLLIVEQFGA
jgi:hypothetical protein